MKDSARAATRMAPAGFFVLRTPLLPLDAFFGWSVGLTAAAALEPARADAIAADLEQLRSRLRVHLGCPTFRDALFLASPSLEMSLDAWLAAPDSERGQKVENTLVRYFARITSRPTPFGLFAGCSLGRIGARTAVRLAPHTEYRRHTRIDQERLCTLIAELTADPQVRRHLRYSCNDTLFRGAGRWRYIEVRLSKSGVATYHLVAVEPSPYLDAALAAASPSASHSDLIQAVLASIPDVPRTEAEAFVDSLISSQLLCSDLDSQIIGGDPLERLCEALREHGLFATVARLESLAQNISALDRGGLGRPRSAYQPLAAGLLTIPQSPAATPLVHVDLWKPTVDAQLDETLVADVTRGATLLARLTRSRSDSDLSRFKSAFRARYEARSVPLLDALDPECGIGFGASGTANETAALIAELTLRPRTPAATTSFSAIDALLLQLLTTALKEGASQIAITEQHLAELPPGQPLASSVAALGVLLAASDAAPWRFRLDAVLGPSAVNLLTRFCHADPMLHQQVRAFCAAEQAEHPDVLLAEIAHRPHGHSSNVALRPALRDYEIPLLCQSGSPPDHQLALADLWLTLEGEQLIVTSRRLRRRVLPRLGSAHNHAHSRNVSLYRFLAALQEQEGLISATWSWGPLAAADYLPRVVSGPLILAPSRWWVTGTALRPILSLPSRAARFDALGTLRRNRGLPRLLSLVEGDSTLLIDLDNILSAEAFLDRAKGQTRLLLEEYLLLPGSSPVTGPEGQFANELIIPLRRPPPETNTPSAPPLLRSQRTLHPPLSDWLYCKLYTSEATADRVLLQCVGPLVRELHAAGCIERWFFVRYADPERHLRLRFNGPPDALHTTVLRRLTERIAPLVADGSIARWGIDTYQPEWERYGGDDGLALSESIFTADSQAALSILAHVVGEASTALRWQATLASMAGLLHDLFPDPAQRLTVVSAAQRDFAAELSIDKMSTRRIGARFRADCIDLKNLVAAAEGLRSGLPFTQAIHQRSIPLATLAQKLHAADRQNRLTTPLPLLARSYLHMTANRLLRSTARAQEAILYDFLARLYRSHLARSPR